MILEKKDNKVLLLSEKPVGKESYTHVKEGITWVNSPLRKWLNSDYLNQNFSEYEKSAIVETKLINSENSEYHTLGENDTMDKIFLLSVEEVNQYLPSEEERITLDRTATAVDWWLRSPSRYSGSVMCVDEDGSIGKHLHLL